jgi:Fic family protein
MVDHELFADQAEKIRLQGRNAYNQAREVVRLIRASGEALRLKPDDIKILHNAAIKGIYTCAGEYRTKPVQIRGSRHVPPDHQHVEGLVIAMCDQANGELDWPPLQTAAYLMWRLNWIHPFGGGNGRTSRAVAYLGLCVRLGFMPPGYLSVAEQIVKERARYQAALEDADDAWLAGVLDISKMTSFLDSILVQQFLSFPSDGPRV